MGITDPTEPYFKDGQWGWDGTQWRKLALLFGYYDRIGDVVAENDAVAGTNILSGDPVPAGEIWVVQTVSAVDSNNIPTSIRVDVTDGTLIGILAHDQNPAAGVYLVWTGQIVLKEGDYLSAVFAGVTLDDNLRLRWWGYKMLIAE